MDVPDPLARVNHLLATARRFETSLGAGKMVWREWGQGTPLLLLHGGAGSWRHWARNIEPLTARYRVIAPDLPGLGESDLPPPGTDLWGLAAAVSAGMAARLGVGAPYHLAGFSFGATIAGHVAARAGAQIRHLAILGASSLGMKRDQVPLLSVRDRVGEKRAEAHRENLARLMIGDPSRIDAEAIAIQGWNSDHARYRSRNVTDPASLRRALEEVSAPLSVIYGERDAVVVPYMEERLDYFRARGTEPLIVKGAGHWIAFEAPEPVNEALLAL